MIGAIKNFLIACLGVALCLFLGWFYFHNKALARVHKTFENRFFISEPKIAWIALRGDIEKFPENSMPAFKAAAGLNPKIILWADVMLSRDGIPVVTRHQDLSIYGSKDAYTPLLNFTELQKINTGKQTHILSLEELVSEFPNRRFILNLVDDSPGFEEQLVKAIHYTDDSHRFIITSERDKILKSSRKVAPMLLYGASTPQLTQLLILSNLFLETTAPLDSDILIVENVTDTVRNFKRVHLNEKMVAEAHRRSIKVFAGNAQNSDDAEALLRLGVDGIVSDHPQSLKNFFEKHDFGR